MPRGNLDLGEIGSAEPDYERFFDLSVDLLCVAGFDGFFKRLNPVWTRALGWSVAELRSQPFLEFVHPEDRASTTAEARRLSGAVPTVNFENRYVHKNGTYRWLRWTANADPEARLFYAVARDVSGEKLLEEELGRRVVEFEALKRPPPRGRDRIPPIRARPPAAAYGQSSAEIDRRVERVLQGLRAARELVVAKDPNRR